MINFSLIIRNCDGWLSWLVLNMISNSSGIFMRKRDGQIGVKINTVHQLMDIDTDMKISELWM